MKICSFCGKDDKSNFIITGPLLCCCDEKVILSGICDDCVEQCVLVLKEQKLSKEAKNVKTTV